MQWWNDFVNWWLSDNGQQVLVSAVIPFLAIVVAGVIAALIGRGATRRLVAQRDQETRAAAVAALISAGQNATRWHSQSPAAREHAEHLANDADVMVRLLPIAGAGQAADWASHQLADMRVNSVNFSYPSEHTLAEYRERLVLWLHRPKKARKLFAADLERWRYEDEGTDPLVLDQQKWAEEQSTAAPAVAAAAAEPGDRYSSPLAVPAEPSATSADTDPPAAAPDPRA